MTHRSLSTPNSGLRVFSACLLSFLLIMMPFVQLAAAEKRSEVRGQRQESRQQAAEGRQQDTEKNAASENVFVNPSLPAPAPLVGPVIVATKDDGLATAATVAPGGTINYSVNIKNNGTVSPTDDATGVTFTDIIDAHTTLVLNSAVAAVSDRYSAIGNVRLSIPDGPTDLLANDTDPDTGNNNLMTVTGETKSSTQCAGCNNVTINTNGSFTYDPPVGFSGTDTFTYTAHSTVGGGTATETVTITVANEIWFINNNAGACPSAPCDGRLSHPFVSLAAFNAANLGGAGQPGDNDWIFIYESATPYDGPATLRSGQKFIGQDATASLASLTGFPAASGTDQLNFTNSGAIVNITATNVNGINLNSGNTLRGFTVGNVGTGTKISGSSFGTLVVGNSGSPDVLLNGTGRALSLTTGTLAVTGGFISVESTSGTQGVSLSGIADSDGSGLGSSFSFGSTFVSNSTTQGIQIGTTTADLNFGNTTVSSTGSAIDISMPVGAANTIAFGTTSANTTGLGTTAVSWTGVLNTTLTFNSLSITRNNATALSATGGGTVNVTTNGGSITATNAGGPAIVASNITLNANFSSINSSNGTNGVSLTTVSGTSNFGGGSLTTSSLGVPFSVSGGSVSVTYSGGITQSQVAAMVSVTGGHNGTLTFQTGTLSATLGTGLQFNGADGIYTFSGPTNLGTGSGGDAGIDIIDGSAGTFTFANTTINNPSGVAVNVDGTPNANTGGISLAGSISKTTDARLISFNNYDTGTATISATLSCTSLCDGIEVKNNGLGTSGTVNFTAATKTLNTSGDTAVNLDNNDGGQINFTGGGLDIDTTTGGGFNAINGGTVTVQGSGNSVTSTSGANVTITNTTIGGSNVTFERVDHNGNNTAITLTNTGAGTFDVTGVSTTAGSGGTIENIVGADAVKLTTTGGLVTLKNMIIEDITHVNDSSAALDTRSGIDAIQGQTVNGGLTLNNVTIRRISDDGINGTVDGVTPGNTVFNGLTITNSTFQHTNRFNVANFGDSQVEAAVYIQGIKGTVSVTGSTFQNCAGGLFMTTDTSGTLDMTVRSNTFTTLYKEIGTASKGNFGISLVQEAGSLSSTVRIGDTTNETNASLGNTFTNAGNLASIRVVTNTGATGAMKVSVAKNTMNFTDHSSPGQPAGNTIYNFPQGGVLYRSLGTGNYEGIFAANVLNEAMHADGGIGQLSLISERGANEFIVRNNTFNKPWDAPVELRGDGANGGQTCAVLFTGNTYVDGIVGDGTTDLGGQSPYNAFYVQARNNGRMDLTMQNEATPLGLTDSSSATGSYSFYAQTTSNGDIFNLFLQNIQGPRGYRLNQTASSGTNTFNLYRNGSASGTAQGVLQDNGNRGGGGVDTTNPPTVNATGTITLSNSAPALPSISNPLILAEGGVAGAFTVSPVVATLDQLQLDAIVASAKARWSKTGMTQQQLAAMRELKFELGDLSGDYLGLAEDNRIVVDGDAQGKGWFVDLTPMDDLEFGNRTSATRSYTNPFTSAAGRIDLLTAIEHEIGHRLGLSDSYSENDRDSIMYGYLTVGERRVPATGQAANAKAGLTGKHFLKLEEEKARDTKQAASRRNHVATSRAVTAPVVVDTVTANIGNLPAGGSVTITFQVTVNDPPNLTLLNPPRVENQGTVTGNGGINVLTDDPNVVGGPDKTATRIDLFDVNNVLGSSPNPSNDGEEVTFTATITENPDRPSADPTGTVNFIDTSSANAVLCNSAISGPAGGPYTATCQVSNLSAGSTHNIRADYSGDGNFDPQQSNVVAQVVNACTINPVVTNTSDTNDGVCDANCSLREAIATVCSAPSNNITFNIPIADPGFVGGVYTITALTELAVSKNVNITGPNSITNTNPIVVSGNNVTRVLKVNAGKSATITALTLRNGLASGASFPDTHGGAIFNSGTLTLINSTVKDSVAKGGAGGIYTGAGTTLNITRSTISGNSIQDAATGGGGITVDAATATLINSTISGNSAGTGGQGGGIHNSAGTMTITNCTIAENTITGGGGSSGGINTEGGGAVVNIGNTIVANNVAGVDPDVKGTFNSQDYNLIENVGSATIGGTTANNITGQDPGIGPLANNGGPTFTHRIISNGSPAMDAGNTALTTDQRGQPRPKDNLSVPNASGGDGDDIGAYEAPLPPNAPDLDAASDTGASSTDNYTADNTPTFTIQGVETGAFVELLAGATVVASGTVASLCSGLPCIQLTSSMLADGPYSMTARQTVAGGLSPTSTGANIIIDTGVPAAPTIDLVAGSDSGSNSDDITNAGTRTFDIGNTETGATVELLRNGTPVGGTITGNGGTVQLSDSTAAVSGTTYAYTARQTDGGGNQTSSAPLNVLFDNVGPTVAMSSVAPNPTNTSPIPVTVLFNESVNGFTAADIVPGNATVINFAGSGANYTFDLLPSGQGLVTADINAAAAQDTAGNDNSAATQLSRTFDTVGPTANITDVTPDPRNNSVSSITIVFSEAVVNFDMADLTLTRDGGPNLLTGAQTLSSGDGGITWTLGNLSGITGTQGTYLLTLTAATSGITDGAGNALAGDATDMWVVDTTGPTVTINQAAGQVDPTSSSPINFTVVFNEPVTGFTNTDVTFSGAGATTATVTQIAPNDGTTYNVAISGMNANGTVQASVNVNAAQDAVGNNSAASTSTDNTVQFINAITINIHDAKVAEPASPNTVDMVFTVSLSAPAPAGGISVNFTTNNGSAISGICGPVPTGDYTSNSGTVNFAMNQQVATINVSICSDSVFEGDETLTVTLTPPVTSPGVIGVGSGTGTITAANPAGSVLISEIRTSGPGGAGDDFVEIYNNSNAPLTVPAGGYGLFKMGADCNAQPVLVYTIPAGTIIPARGHYLITGPAYSLNDYGGTNAARGDNNPLVSPPPPIADIATDANVGLFSTADVTQISSVNRLDAVGFGANVNGACNLLREPSNLPAIAANATIEHSYFRKMCDWIQGQACTVPGIPKDTNNNADDFWLADTAGSPITDRLGAPGPENLASPIRRDNANNPGSGGIDVFLLDRMVGSSAAPNRTRKGSDPDFPGSTFGTMTLRYRVTNNTGGNVTRLRYRIVDITTKLQGPNADLRALTGVPEPTVGPVNDPVTCAPGGTPCNVTVNLTTLETPPAQGMGGGYNSTLSSGTITATPGSQLAPGASILINFKLGVEKTGTFRFYIIVEALP